MYAGMRSVDGTRNDRTRIGRAMASSTCVKVNRLCC
jgi:hypothetical protein